MKLHYADPSPYARKVRVLAHETGLLARLELMSDVVSPVQPNSELGKQNPLMKVPTLVTDDGVALFDSPVICQYLDSLHSGPKLVPSQGPARWRALRLEALADGITDAALLWRYETVLRPEERQWSAWIDGQLAKVTQGLDQVEREAEQLEGEVTVGQIALACSIDWMEFRKVGGALRDGRPQLFSWYGRFASRPSMLATAPKR